ncbi:MAG: hypothetical protein L3K09_07455, partial [Thermoplasmata archaeon]|nr:hypothetical protein [Thermoplasmata archaeon]
MLADGQSTLITLGSTSVRLSDALSSGPSPSASVRSYFIHVSVSQPLPKLTLELTTNPVWGLSTPDRNPGGAVALPRLSLWNAEVFRGPVNDTKNWTLDPTGTLLIRSVGVKNASFHLVGSSNPSASVSVNVARTDGSHVPGVSFMMISPGSSGGVAIPWNDADFSSQLKALHPTVIRLGQTTAVPTSWDNRTQQPVFGMYNFNRMAALIQGLGAGIILSMPAGSWGDGNFLPSGMPLNKSILINWGGHGAGSGYFPSDGAYYAYISSFVNATIASNISVRYWNIGNEVPVKNGANITTEFTRLFNIASHAIHKHLPTALVGTDVMLVPTAFPYFAAHAKSVGFLSFHYYPVNSTCPTPNTYCLPSDSAGYWRDPTLWLANHSLYGGHFLAPLTAQSQWFNVTGHYLPVLATESNMAKSPVFGTDPRQQMLFGATWLINSMMDAASQNVTSYTYYTLEAPPNGTGQLSAPFGGWGWGMLNESSNDTGLPYAPYWALTMWGAALPAGASGVVTASSDPSLVRSYGCVSGTNASLVIINKVDVPVTIPLSGIYARSGTKIRLTTLDQTSYVEVFSSSLHRELLQKSGTTSLNGTTIAGGSITISGYGVAVVSWTPGPPPGAPNPSSGVGQGGERVPFPSLGGPTLGAGSTLTPGSGPLVPSPRVADPSGVSSSPVPWNASASWAEPRAGSPIASNISNGHPPTAGRVVGQPRWTGAPPSPPGGGRSSNGWFGSVLSSIPPKSSTGRTLLGVGILIGASGGLAVAIARARRPGRGTERPAGAGDPELLKGERGEGGERR